MTAAETRAFSTGRLTTRNFSVGCCFPVVFAGDHKPLIGWLYCNSLSGATALQEHCRVIFHSTVKASQAGAQGTYVVGKTRSRKWLLSHLARPFEKF